MLDTIEITSDFCIIGGGMAGICAAIAASREGVKVVLMHDRPVLGGNASSEIRMWICGAQGNNNTETGIMEEIFMENLNRNPYKLWPVFDSILWDFIKAEKNITLLMNCSCMNCEMDSINSIKSITGWQTTTQRFYKIYSKIFADCSGDSILAPLSGAKFRIGREDPNEFNENVKIKSSDKKTMGNSCLIQAHKTNKKVTFSAPDFAKKINSEDIKYRRPDLNNDSENFWYLELGGDRDTIGDSEYVRDELVALAFGMWDYIKNSGEYEDADYWQLDFIGFLPGKRESRRLVGKVIVNQNDIINDTKFSDVVAYGGWPLDDHDPAGFYYNGHPNISYQTTSPYCIPFRALYSENINNLLFAGRNISMTHAAMSSSRVMATCALCGQAIGSAASISKKYNCNPEEIYKSHISELQELLLWNDCMLPNCKVKIKTKDNFKGFLNNIENVNIKSLNDNDERNNVFICEFGDIIEYKYFDPIYINEIRIIFDSDLNRETLPGSDCERKHMMRCNRCENSPVMCLPSTLCKSFQVEINYKNGKSEIIENNNTRRLVKIPVNKSNVISVKLRIIENHSGGNQARIFSLRIK